MRTVEDCLDDLQDDAYPYSETLIEFVDADVAEGLIKAICQAVQSGNAASLPFFAQSLGQAVNDAMFDRAVKESKRTFNPLHDSFGDVEKALEALTIRG
jgi:hypothetical protein